MPVDILAKFYKYISSFYRQQNINKICRRTPARCLKTAFVTAPAMQDNILLWLHKH